jgi:hypothetical protein
LFYFTGKKPSGYTDNVDPTLANTPALNDITKYIAYAACNYTNLNA